MLLTSHRLEQPGSLLHCLQQLREPIWQHVSLHEPGLHASIRVWGYGDYDSLGSGLGQGGKPRERSGTEDALNHTVSVS